MRLMSLNARWLQAGRADLAVKMFTDLKRWDDARFVAGQAQGADVRELTREQAQWALHNKDWRTAASILVTSGEFGKAIEIMAANELYDDLVDVVRCLPPPHCCPYPCPYCTRPWHRKPPPCPPPPPTLPCPCPYRTFPPAGPALVRGEGGIRSSHPAVGPPDAPSPAPRRPSAPRRR